MNVAAQTSGEIWSEPLSISGSGEYAASDPYLVADAAGSAHLFYSQRFSREFGQPDTLMYAKWDGRNWNQPVDIFISSRSIPNDAVLFPSAIIDDEGMIHLIWMGAPAWPNYSLNYSTAYSGDAVSASAWSTKMELASDLTGTNYSMDIAYSAPETIHVVYARVQQGDNPPEQRAVSYVRTTDRGETWTDPVDIHTIAELNHGASNVRVIAQEPDKVFAVWSEWNDVGNGERVFFARSLDGGQTWDDPVILSETKPNEYERDWPNIASLGGDSLVVMWEGGFRAYRHAMYSHDNGETWSDPIDTFPGLIGENGYAQFARDGDGNLHVFVAQRIREGNPENLIGNLGLWHSVWQGGTQWSRPTLAGPPVGMVNPTVALVGGNQAVAAWFSFSDYRVRVSVGKLGNVSAKDPVVRNTPTATVEEASTQAVATLTPTPAPNQVEISQQPPSDPFSQLLLRNPGMTVLVSIVPSALVMSIIIFLARWWKQRRT